MAEFGPAIESWHPTNYYGFVILLLLPIVGVFMIVNHTQRRSPMVVKRAYLFLVLQHAGVVINGVIFGVGYLQYPHLRCYLAVWAAWLFFPLFCLPLVLRCWIYAFRYYLTRDRKATGPLLRTSSSFSSLRQGSGDVVHPTIWLRYLWVLNPSFLIKLYIVALLVQMVVPVAISILMKVKYHPQEEMEFVRQFLVQCGIFQTYTPFIIVLVVFYVLVIIFTVVVLWRSQDAYYIKAELKYTIILWLIVLPFWLLEAYPVKGFEIMYYLPPGGILMIGAYGTFIFSGIVLSYLTIKSNRLDANGQDLSSLLKRQSFRDEFCNYLCLQLCVENLHMYEAIENYRVLTDLAELQIVCLLIFDIYIRDGASSQVNLSGSVVAATRAKMAAGGPLENMQVIFDEAREEVFSSMTYHSLPHFLSQRKRKSWSSSSSMDSSSDVMIGGGGFLLLS